MNRVIQWGVAAALLPLAAGAAGAQTQPAAPRHAALGPVDTYFLTQTAMGTPFQVTAGRLAYSGTTTPDIRAYADLVVGAHIAAINELRPLLAQNAPLPPPTLLQAAYATMVATLRGEQGAALDADYIRGQVAYQNADAELYRYEIANGSDPDLKAFAQRTLPKIEEQLARAKKLQDARRP